MIDRIICGLLGIGQSPYATLPVPDAAPAPSAPRATSASKDGFVTAASARYGAGDVRTARTSREARQEQASRTFEWDVSNVGGKSAKASISAELNEREVSECAHRGVPPKTAQDMKRHLAAAGGEITARELAALSGKSLSYAQKFVSAMNAAALS